MVVLQGVRLVAAGVGLGLVVAAGVTRLLSGLLYGTEPLDPVTFASVAGVMVGVGLLASYLPARRASRVDPVASMRVD